MIKIAINGFGRIGRLAFRQMFKTEGYDIVAINDLTSPDMLAHLLKYDSAQKRYEGHTIKALEDSIVVDDEEIRIYKETDPKNLPWKELGVDVVFECTGVFASREKS
ncbi:MAG: glyceraldehyde 3-phosphate dehydrogenase NAD-binding domain-containing protein, partial [Cetobacterium sp.]